MLGSARGRILGGVSDVLRSPAQYPVDREADVVLRDGSTVHVRPIRADDEQAIRAFLTGISLESIGFRFFGMPDLEWVDEVVARRRLRRPVRADRRDRHARAGSSPMPAYIRIDDDRAEVAFLVADAWQGRGISTIMLAHLAAAADQHGISSFAAEVLPANHRMIDVFRQSGFPIETRSTPDAIEIEFPTSLSPSAHRAVPRARANGGDRGGQPVSRAALGGRHRRLAPARNDRRRGPAQPDHRRLQRLRATPSTPTRTWCSRSPPTASRRRRARARRPRGGGRSGAGCRRGCPRVREAGVRALLVISAGFAETGEEGAQRQRELVAVCRESGMRLVGPNCLGVLNTDPAVGLNATFAPRQAPCGRVGLMSQSGGVGIAIIEAASRLGIGLSTFVSVGNKADLSGNDLLEYWEQDPRTDVALLYLESFGNPRQVRPRGAPLRAHQADPRRQERTLSGRGAGDFVAYRRAAVRLGRDRRRALSPGRRDPYRHSARAVRRCRAAGQTADSARGPDRDRNERRRAGDHLRRRVPGERGAGAGARAGGARGAGASAPPRRLAGQPARPDRVGDRRGLRCRDPDADGRWGVRCDRGDLRAAAGDAGGGRRRSRARRRPGRGRLHDRGGLHDGEGTPPELARSAGRGPRLRFPEDAARGGRAGRALRGVESASRGRIPRPRGTCRPDEAAAIISRALAAGSQLVGSGASG